jgi:hypothetical protein
MGQWKYGRLRRLTPAQVDDIRVEALAAFTRDARDDPRYATETVEHLANEAKKDTRWWLEFLSSDPDTWEDILGFNPLAEDQGLEGRNALVAKKVMGWAPPWDTEWSPFTNITHAWEVVEKLAGLDICLTLGQTEDKERWGAHFHRSGPVDDEVVAGIVPLRVGRGLVDSLWVWVPANPHGAQTAICTAALRVFAYPFNQ